MFVRSFRPHRFLQSVYGTTPFFDYCQQRLIPFAQVPGQGLRNDDVRRWTDALQQLTAGRQLHVELELATVNELSAPESVAHLLEAIQGRELPPDSIPGGAPLALWVFLRYPTVFQEVF